MEKNGFDRVCRDNLEVKYAMLIVIITRLIFVYIYDISHTSQGMLTSISNSVRT